MNGKFRLTFLSQLSFCFLVLSVQACLGQTRIDASSTESSDTPQAQSIKPIDPLKLGGFKGVDLFGPNTKPVLSPLLGLASSQIAIQAEQIPVNLKGMLGVNVKVKNNTDRPLYFLGDEALATTGDAVLSAAHMPEIEDLIPSRDNPKNYGRRSFKATLTAALTVGALQTVEDEITERGPMDGRYGWDNARRIDRQARFAKRVLWPGDSTEGTLFFKTANQLHGASLEMKVSAYYDNSDRASVKCNVK
ncbi:MAG: hypothetical protein K2X81_04290 [Candidatus Obscuribacterales bacterium]|nr:hypothetical protein [Candidatus Obscuribacterales bacterium]